MNKFLKQNPNGFLLSLISTTIQFLHFISPVEILKKISGGRFENSHLTGEAPEISKAINNNVVDLFITAKWLYLAILIVFRWGGIINLIVICVLMFFNLFTYFFYHVWHPESLVGEGITVTRVRRRLIAILLAIAFSHLGFAYLYYVQFPRDFVNNAAGGFIHWFWFSASNAVAANYDAIKPFTCRGYHLSMVQLLVSFIFITLILSKSLPNAKAE